METCRRIEGLVDFIAAGYRDVAEIGIGLFPDVAYALLKKGLKVFATDVRCFRYSGLKVVEDDIMSPKSSLYTSVDLIYSMRPPPELIPYMRRLAETISADLIIKPLSSDYGDGRLIRYGETTFFIHRKKVACQTV